MTSYISAELRRIVASRANHVCEYCLIHESDTYLGCQVDHIISEKHSGPTIADNLCYACVFCNRSKGADIGSIATNSRQFTRFYHPRTDRWLDHFSLNGSLIDAVTEIGEVTQRILGFNTTERLLERETLIRVGRYPSPEAGKLLAHYPI